MAQTAFFKAISILFLDSNEDHLYQPVSREKGLYLARLISDHYQYIFFDVLMSRLARISLKI